MYDLRNGCTGGFNSDAIRWVIDHKHMATRRNLPYIAKGRVSGEVCVSVIAIRGHQYTHMIIGLIGQ